MVWLLINYQLKILPEYFWDMAVWNLCSIDAQYSPLVICLSENLRTVFCAQELYLRNSTEFV